MIKHHLFLVDTGLLQNTPSGVGDDRRSKYSLYAPGCLTRKEKTIERNEERKYDLTRICPEYVQSISIVCPEFVQGKSRVCPRFDQSISEGTVHRVYRFRVGRISQTVSDLYQVSGSLS